MSALTMISDALREAVELDANAIEHALHTRRLANLGLRTDAEVLAAIVASLREAGPGQRAMSALATADYADNPAAFAARWRAALWRSCQLHRCEDAYWRLVGQDPALVPAPLLEQLGCVDPDCGSDGPFDLASGWPRCPRHRRSPDEVPGGAR